MPARIVEKLASTARTDARHSFAAAPRHVPGRMVGNVTAGSARDPKQPVGEDATHDDRGGDQGVSTGRRMQVSDRIHGLGSDLRGRARQLG